MDESCVPVLLLFHYWKLSNRIDDTAKGNNFFVEGGHKNALSRITHSVTFIILKQSKEINQTLFLHWPNPSHLFNSVHWDKFRVDFSLNHCFDAKAWFIVDNWL